MSAVRVDGVLELLKTLRVALQRIAARQLVLVPHALWALLALLGSQYAAGSRAACFRSQSMFFVLL